MAFSAASALAFAACCSASLACSATFCALSCWVLGVGTGTGTGTGITGALATSSAVCVICSATFESVVSASSTCVGISCLGLGSGTGSSGLGSGTKSSGRINTVSSGLGVSGGLLIPTYSNPTIAMMCTPAVKARAIFLCAKGGLLNFLMA